MAGISAIAGFSKTIMTAKKTDPQYFEKGVQGSLAMQETGANLAMRALGWGTLYAFLGTGTICFAIWKMTGATNVSITVELCKLFRSLFLLFEIGICCFFSQILKWSQI